MGVILKGLLTGGFSFLSSWWEGKQEEAKMELQIKQAQKATDNTIKLKYATGEIEADNERIKQMELSWKDEWFTLLFSIPLVNLFISPFVDLIMIGEYQEGMLASAANTALQNLDSAPTWYVFIIVVMVMLSYGYRKGIDQILGIWSKFRK
ncbi:hypothetical protein [Vibrio phage S4-7]|nr:hypothetical protein [Vibrio phage S4-7]